MKRPVPIKVTTINIINQIHSLVLALFISYPIFCFFLKIQIHVLILFNAKIMSPICNSFKT